MQNARAQNAQGRVHDTESRPTDGDGPHERLRAPGRRQGTFDRAHYHPPTAAPRRAHTLGILTPELDSVDDSSLPRFVAAAEALQRGDTRSRANELRDCQLPADSRPPAAGGGSLRPRLRLPRPAW